MKCIISSCEERWEKDKIKKYSFHNFPKQQNQCRKWKVALKQHVNVTIIPNVHRVCEKHFLPSCFGIRYGRRILLADAIPTVFDAEIPFIVAITEPLAYFLMRPRKTSIQNFDDNSTTSHSHVFGSSTSPIPPMELEPKMLCISSMNVTTIESVEQKIMRLEEETGENRMSIHQKIQIETEEEREKRLQNSREKRQLKRNNETHEEMQRRLKEKAIRSRKYQLNQLQEKRKKRKIDNIENKQNEETEEEHIIKLEIQALWPEKCNEQLKSEASRSRIYFCNICPRSFMRPSVLESHKKLHEPPGGYICKICRKTFCTNKERHQHKQVEHKTTSIRTCDKCNQKFKTTLQYRKHKNTKCKTKKRFLCRICKMYFISIALLRSHRLTHRSYSCKYCEKKFPTNRTLSRHEKRHSKCDICNKQFKSHRALVIHEIKHTGKKPFKCNVCKDLFTLPYELISHQAQHNQTQTVKNISKINDNLEKNSYVVKNDSEHKSNNVKELINIPKTSSELSNNVCKDGFVSVSNSYQDQFISAIRCKIMGNIESVENKDNKIINPPTSLDNHKEKWNINILSRPKLLHHNDGSMKMYCSICHKTIIDLTIWDRHKNTHAGGFISELLRKRQSTSNGKDIVVRKHHKPKQKIQQNVIKLIEPPEQKKNDNKETSDSHNAETEKNTNCRIDILSEPKLIHSTDGMHCSTCQITIKDLNIWNCHKKVHAGGFINDILKKRQSSSVKKQPKKQKYYYKCKDCGKQYGNCLSYEYHLKKHSETVKSHKCVVCNMTFVYNANLVKHWSSHPEFKPYMCENCHTKFSSLKEFHEHRLIKLTTCGLPQFSDVIIVSNDTEAINEKLPTTVDNEKDVVIKQEADLDIPINTIEPISSDDVIIKSENIEFGEEMIYETVVKVEESSNDITLSSYKYLTRECSKN